MDRFVSSFVGLLATAALLVFASGCTHVRASRRNPQNGESWTVYSHTFEDDTVSYCAPPQWGGGCYEARRYSRAPDVMPSQAYSQPQVQPLPWPTPAPWPPAPAPGWGR